MLYHNETLLMYLLEGLKLKITGGAVSFRYGSLKCSAANQNVNGTINLRNEV